MTNSKENPFFTALDAGCPADHIFTLATCVKVAHSSSDVWAACRAACALGNYAVTVSRYLDGKYFSAWFDDTGNCAELVELREFAHEFYDARKRLHVPAEQRFSNAPTSSADPTPGEPNWTRS